MICETKQLNSEPQPEEELETIREVGTASGKPSGPSAPRLVQRSSPLVVVRRGDDVALPCVAHGYPPPQYCAQEVHGCSNNTPVAVRLLRRSLDLAETRAVRRSGGTPAMDAEFRCLRKDPTRASDLERTGCLYVRRDFAASRHAPDAIELIIATVRDGARCMRR
ncbi:Protein of unknown function [Gryllus bimaculatus]|nr:Protein of unknown function [Gryllus bimaculatus]